MYLKELAIENAICKWLDFNKARLKIQYRRTKVKGERHVANGREFFKKSQNRGMSDLTCCVQGKYVCIEIKTEKGKQTPLQVLYEQEVLEAGGIYFVARSIDDVILNFQKHGLLTGGYLCTAEMF